MKKYIKMLGIIVPNNHFEYYVGNCPSVNADLIEHNNNEFIVYKRNEKNNIEEIARFSDKLDHYVIYDFLN